LSQSSLGVYGFQLSSESKAGAIPDQSASIEAEAILAAKLGRSSFA